MKLIPNEHAAQAVGTIWGGLMIASSAARGVADEAAQGILARGVDDFEAFAISFAAGAIGALVAWAATRGGLKEKLATVLSSVGFACLLGPVTSQIVMASNGIGPALTLQVIVGVSFVWSLIGWPTYKALRFLFEALEDIKNPGEIITRIFRK